MRHVCTDITLASSPVTCSSTAGANLVLRAMCRTPGAAAAAPAGLLAAARRLPAMCAPGRICSTVSFSNALPLSVCALGYDQAIMRASNFALSCYNAGHGHRQHMAPLQVHCVRDSLVPGTSPKILAVMRRRGWRLQRIPAAAASAAAEHQRRRRPWCAALEHRSCFIWGVVILHGCGIL